MALSEESDPSRRVSVRRYTVPSGEETWLLTSTLPDGVTLTSAMHTLIGVDGGGRPITPLLTFADNRAAAQAKRIKAQPDAPALYRRTGTPMHPMSPLAKLVWYREREAGTFAAVRHWLSVKEYLALYLFGELVVDHSVAAASGLLNLRALDWDADALALAGVTREQLATLVPTRHVCRGLRGEAAAEVGLDPATPVVIGASDGVLANLGVGALGPQIAACSVGTSAAVRVVLDEPRTDPHGRLFCYPLTEDRWSIGGATNNGGIVLRWVRDRLFPEVARAATAAGDDPYEALVGLTDGIAPGADGLIMLPYLTGERAPHWSSLPRGVLFGLQRHHGRGHVVRAVLEGIVFQLYAVLRSLEEFGIRPSEVRATGGFTRSPLWRQIMADVFDRPIATPAHAEGTSLGAAMLGRVALGLEESLESAARVVRVSQLERPIPEHAAAYRGAYEVFERLYERLLPEFEAAADG
jgi:gluconokinase